jgi:NADH dehydrogenase/NADH:ubiquinone oxidoreductase subunit G
MADTITLTINEKQVTAEQGKTLLEVCRENGIDIPTLCYMEGLFPSGACRMCVVEVEGARGLVPS